MIDILVISLYGQKIGTLSLLPNQQMLFSFTEDYIRDNNRPTLSMSLIDAFGQLITDVKPSRAKLPSFFSNLLPEGFLREYVAAKGGVRPHKEFDLLKLLGPDLPGAITVTSIEASTTSETEEHHHLEEKSDNDILRFSLAGVQMKFSAIMGANARITIPGHGIGGSWIIKFPSANFISLPENEYAMLKLAEAIGIEVPESHLINISNISNIPDIGQNLTGNVLAVKRFDRADNHTAIHMEDFAQIFGIFPEQKYELVSYTNMASMIWSTMGENALLDFIQRIVFNALIGNADMHLKNWSVLYKDRINPTLAPAYDLVSTIAYINDTKMALSFAGVKEMKELSVDLCKRFCAKAKLPETLVVKTALDTTRKFLAVWHKTKYDLGIHEIFVDKIDQHLSSIQIVTELK